MTTPLSRSEAIERALAFEFDPRHDECVGEGCFYREQLRKAYLLPPDAPTEKVERVSLQLRSVTRGHEEYESGNGFMRLTVFGNLPAGEGPVIVEHRPLPVAAPKPTLSEFLLDNAAFADTAVQRLGAECSPGVFAQKLREAARELRSRGL